MIVSDLSSVVEIDERLDKHLKMMLLNLPPEHVKPHPYFGGKAPGTVKGG